MTSIVVVKKNGYATIAADTLTKWGSGKESAEYINNNTKILNIKDNYIALAGNATFKLALLDYFSDKKEIQLASVMEIFRTWNKLHLALKTDYHLMPEEEKEDPIESTRIDTLIANRFGIFGVSGHRTVQEFSKYYAYGSGSDYALGALWAAYHDGKLSSEDLAKMAIESASEFDDATGLPVHYQSIEIT